MKPPPVVCHHCGRDYAREYWASSPTLENPKRRFIDPRICPSCSRDTNPDAADAPQWVAPPKSDSKSLVRAYQVSNAEKQCRVCGGRWNGLIFGPVPAKGSPPPFGICESCADAEEAKVAVMSVRTVLDTMTLPAMQRPRRVVGLGDD